MDNSFKRAYEKDVRADGSVELRFKSSRWGSHKAQLAGLAFGFIIFPASCAVAYRVFGLTWLGLVASVILSVAVMIFLSRSKTTIVVKPKDGVLFNSKSIPFSDIKYIGTNHETTSRDAKGSAYVFVESFGNSIRISGHTTPELADAIAGEIKATSGSSWK